MPQVGGLHYEIHGAPDAPPLILSSGLGGSAGYWAPNIAALAAHFRVIAYDQRGTGRSDRALPLPTSVEAMAQDMLALMDALGIGQAHLVGHALGGLIGLSLAMRAPDRLTRLVVVNGWARLDPYTARCFDVRLALLRGGGPAAYLRAQPIFLYPPEWSSANDAHLEAEAAEQHAHFPDDAIVEARITALRAWDPGEALSGVKIPVLVLATEDDALVPSHASRLLARLLPNRSRMVQPRGGHAGNVTEPEDFHARVLPWLLAGDGDEEEE